MSEIESSPTPLLADDDSISDEPTDRRSGVSTRTASIVLAVVPAVFLAYPAIYAWCRAGWRGLWQFTASDSMLYMTIARNSQGEFFSFDGTTATNGFHPLFQWVLTLAYTNVPAEALATQHLINLAICTALSSVGYAFLAFAIHRYTRSLFLSLLPLVGLYYLGIGAMFDNQNVWASIDGMEGCLSVFFGSAMLWVMAERLTQPEVTLRSLTVPGRDNVFIRMGLLLPFVVLARLDDVFVAFGLLGLILTLEGRWKDKLTTVIATGAPTGITLIAYMIYNQLEVGSALPLSGASKNGFVFFKSLYIIAASIVPPLTDLKNAVSARQSDGFAFYLNTFRGIQLLYPAAIVLAYFAIVRSHLRTIPKFVVPIGLGAGIVVKALYNLAFVHLWHQGDWYFAFAVMFIGFLVAILLGELISSLDRSVTVRRVVYGLLIAFAIASSSRVASRWAFAPPPPQFTLCRDRVAISDALEAAVPGANILAFDDGALAFCLRQKSMHGFAFAADMDTFRAKQEGRLLRHAFDRGFNILSSAEYIPVTGPIDGPDAAREFLMNSFIEDSVKAEFEGFDFELVHRHEPSSTGYFRFTPRDAAALDRGTDARSR